MGPHDIAASDYDQVAELLRGFYLRSHRAMDGLMAASGASYARTRMLIQLQREGEQRSIDLAVRFGYAPRTVTEAIDGLERDRLVVRNPDPADRRAKRIAITPAGLAVIETAEAARQAFVAQVFGALDAAEAAELVRLMGKLNGRLDALSPREG